MNYMTHFLAFCLLVVLSMQSSLSAAADSPMEKVVTSELTNQAWMAAVRMYADGTGIKLTQYGRGTFRLFALGNVTFKKPEELVKVGEGSLLWLERWTGNQKMFMPRTKSEADAYCIVVTESDALFMKVLDFLREKGAASKPADAKDDLAKAYKTTGGARIFITPAEKFNALDKNWVSNFVGGNALATYYWEHGSHPPVWLHEGLKGELQRIATGRVAIRTVTYEKNDGKVDRSTWARIMKTMIKKKDTELLRSNGVMSLELVGLTHKQYVQLWSYGSFIRAALSGGKKSKNKYAQLIQRTAAGEPDYKALRAILGKRGKSEKAVTMAWWGWARGQK